MCRTIWKRVLFSDSIQKIDVKYVGNYQNKFRGLISWRAYVILTYMKLETLPESLPETIPTQGIGQAKKRQAGALGI